MNPKSNKIMFDFKTEYLVHRINYNFLEITIIFKIKMYFLYLNYFYLNISNINHFNPINFS